MYSTWAIKRRFQSMLTIGGIFLVVASVTVYVIIAKPPTCFDGKKNQDEEGIDCSGVCEARCSFQVFSLATLWVRPFEVSPGFWSMAAYVENPNLDSLAEHVPYHFKLYDADNVLIGERSGETFINGESVVPVFSGGIDTGGRTPKRAFFEWDAQPAWRRLHVRYDVSIEQQRQVLSSTVQRVEAILRNNEVREMRDVEVVALLYDTAGNAMAASRTVVDVLPARGTAKLTFTWPQPFPGPITRIELVPRVSPQQM